MLAIFLGWICIFPEQVEEFLSEYHNLTEGGELGILY
jgi:hypothetical protein